MTFYLAFGPPVVLQIAALVIGLINKSKRSQKLTWATGGLVIAATLYLAAALVALSILF